MCNILFTSNWFYDIILLRKREKSIDSEVSKNMILNNFKFDLIKDNKEFTKRYKEVLKNTGEFELYYGISETEEVWDMIDLAHPLYYSISLDNTYIGYIGFSTYDEIIYEPEIYLFPEYRNKGYGTKILSYFIDTLSSIGIDDKIIKNFSADVRVENLASQKMIMNCGFIEEDCIGWIVHIENKDNNMIPVKSYKLSL